ncbi:hypothetical protein XNC1_0193 [Xenorhabdus nematophila ATCC 19061]|uniref:Uncharacterized protein n=1 Tax=Xenorhabdus nematophila (strain ATCC 19061 / DSM 3370 / CCUG 14189 / LMG 1036 / NCIMB 9965 / AN6) TaxID=406817 RepID=D3VGZ6_XENNA|nr:hypothetical protein XNC1_0193 [Xenorhabdus nematophila ATCC 19061]
MDLAQTYCDVSSVKNLELKRMYDHIQHHYNNNKFPVCYSILAF